MERLRFFFIFPKRLKPPFPTLFITNIQLEEGSDLNANLNND